MRVAANDVERVLQQAEAEEKHARADVGVKRSSDFDNLVAAFNRARELRDKPFRTTILRGRKSRQPQDVIVTNEERSEAGFLYVLCLVPYTKQQLDAAGTYKYVTDVVSPEGKVIKQLWHDSGLTPSYHQQWIRADRLREAA
jgi:hypothetical protein